MGSVEPGRQGAAGGAFGRDRRLTRARQFEAVFRAPRGRARGPYFTVLGIPNQEGVARLGLAVSRRQAKRAVDRNRIKRLVRETFRECQERLGGVDLVVMARGGAREATAAELRSALAPQLERVARACRESRDRPTPEPEARPGDGRSPGGAACRGRGPRT